MSPVDGFLTLREACERLGLSQREVVDLARHDRLPGLYVPDRGGWLFPVTRFEQFMRTDR